MNRGRLRTTALAAALLGSVGLAAAQAPTQQDMEQLRRIIEQQQEAIRALTTRVQQLEGQKAPAVAAPPVTLSPVDIRGRPAAPRLFIDPIPPSHSRLQHDVRLTSRNGIPRVAEQNTMPGNSVKRRFQQSRPYSDFRYVNSATPHRLAPRE